MLRRVLPAFFVIFALSLGLWGWITYRGRIWREEGQRAILIVHPVTNEVSTPLSIAVWRPERRELLLLPLPPELKFRASHNNESYDLASLPRLSAIENWPEVRMRREVSLQFGVVLDGALKVNTSPADLTAQQLIGESAWALVGQRESSLQLWDRLTWWQGLRQTDTLRREKITFDPDWLVADGTLNTGNFDTFARLRFQDERVRRSQWAVRVLNSSGVAGEASRQGRALELIGFNVLLLDTQVNAGESRLRLAADQADQTSQESEESDLNWARSRLQELYADWPLEIDASLPEQKRVEAEIITGQGLPD